MDNKNGLTDNFSNVVSFKKASRDNTYPTVKNSKNKIRARIFAVSPEDNKDFQTLIVETLDSESQRRALEWYTMEQPELYLNAGDVIECTLTGNIDLGGQKFGCSSKAEYVIGIEVMTGEICDISEMLGREQHVNKRRNCPPSAVLK